MRSQTEIKRYSENKYREYLRAVITGVSFFPLEVPFGKLNPAADLGELIDAVRELVSGSKDRQGIGYSVLLADVRTRKYGLQRLPKRVFFDQEEDFVGFLGKRSEVADFKENVGLTRKRCPGLEVWMAANTSKMIEYAEEWSLLLEICAWFVAHPRPHCYSREIPVPIHTKFIEQHTTVLGSMLKEVLPHDHDPLAPDFHSRFYLKDKEAMVRVRISDPSLIQATGIPLPDFAVPVSLFYQLPFQAVPRVLIVENEITFLTIPPLPGTVLIWGLGNGVHLIAEAPWLHLGKRTLYWGDVDARGVTILGWLRRRLPEVRSLLMDLSTLERFPDAEVEDPEETSPEIEENLLTPKEWACYRALTAKRPRRRLEQERIPMEYAVSAIQIAEATT